MKKCFLLIVALLLLLPSTTEAQRRRRPVKTPEVVEDPRVQQMMSNTQQVVFVDSFVVSREGFVSHIPLSPECGSLGDDGTGQLAHTNELADHRVSTLVDSRVDSLTHLFVSDFIGGEWAAPSLAQGLDKAAANGPYMMPDGTTLYFAQQGDNSLGGYDIFVTRYDASSGAFYRAENLGMPFASEADDLLYVIDETNQLGYFVTNRRQPADKVCVYVFLPPDSRQTYDEDDFSEEQMRSLARIGRIADTWNLVEADELQQARQRLASAKQAKVTAKNTHGSPAVDNETARLQAEAATLRQSLQQARQRYAKASPDERRQMAPQLLSDEHQLEQLLLDIKQKAKQERNRAQ